MDILEVNEDWLKGFHCIPDHASLVSFDVSKNVILSKDFSVLDVLMSSVTTSDERIERLRERIHLHLSGYDEDPRDSQEIPEVRGWFAESHDRYPYFFYFINPVVPGITARLYLGIVAIEKGPCPNDHVYRENRNGSSQIVMTPDHTVLSGILMTTASSVVSFCSQHRVPWEATVRSLYEGFPSSFINDMVNSFKTFFPDK